MTACRTHINDIIDVTCEEFGVRREDVCQPGRVGPAETQARYLIAFTASHVTGMSTAEIGMAVRVSHQTILAGIKNVFTSVSVELPGGREGSCVVAHRIMKAAAVRSMRGRMGVVL